MSWWSLSIDAGVTKTDYSFKDRALFSISALLGPWLIRALGALCRYDIIGEEHIKTAKSAGRGIILALWHGRMLLPIYHFRRQGVVSLVSYHRDGEFIARIVERLGYLIRRGSPREGGREGFHAMLRDLKDKRIVAIFPDGPTGPRYSVHDGILHLARLSGAPILPMSFAAKSCWRLGSWDRFMIMKPFSKGVVVFGEPMTVPRRMSTEGEIDEYRNRIRDILIEVESEADRRMGIIDET